MNKKIVPIFLTGLLCCSCKVKQKMDTTAVNTDADPWTKEALRKRSSDHLDTTKWDRTLFQQDIDTYNKYVEIFTAYPLNKSPFPVAEYDYAVSYIPQTIEHNDNIFKTIRIGECEDPDCEVVTDQLTLIILTNDREAEELTLVESRNYPYLTAQGYIKVSNNSFDWVFSASPDGYATLLVNMKLFDLRFGQTIVIFPQSDRSFTYDQLTELPNHQDDFELFVKTVLSSDKIRYQLKSEKNLK